MPQPPTTEHRLCPAEQLHLLEHLLPDVIPQLVLVEVRAPGVRGQVVGNEVVHALPQILVGGLRGG